MSTDCPLCKGKRLKLEALSVKFAELDIAQMSGLPLKELAKLLQPVRVRQCAALAQARRGASGEGVGHSAHRSGSGSARRRDVLNLGLGYLSLERSTPTLSPGELQRLRLATQVRSNLFGVVYVLDEPSAGLHPGGYRRRCWRRSTN